MFPKSDRDSRRDSYTEFGLQSNRGFGSIGITLPMGVRQKIVYDDGIHSAALGFAGFFYQQPMAVKWCVHKSRTEMRFACIIYWHAHGNFPAIISSGLFVPKALF